MTTRNSLKYSEHEQLLLNIISNIHLSLAICRQNKTEFLKENYNLVEILLQCYELTLSHNIFKMIS